MDPKSHTFLTWLATLQGRKVIQYSEIPLDFQTLANCQQERDQLQRTLYDVVLRPSNDESV